MSKKQREKVEDEVRYHKEINHQTGGVGQINPAGGGGGGSGTSPDSTDRNSTVFDTQQPSSTDPFANSG